MQIQLPEKVQYIIQALEGAGFEAYAVGGCVRDSLLGRVPDDWDITTSARPLEVKAVFPRTIDTSTRAILMLWTALCTHRCFLLPCSPP